MRAFLEFYTATQIGGLYLNLFTYAVLLESCWLYALARGGTPERFGALTLLLGYALTVVATTNSTVSSSSVEIGVLVVDLLCLAALVTLAIRAERFWPLWLAALQLLTVAAHGAKFADPETIRRAYEFLMVFWSYPMIFLLIVGTWRHQQRISRLGYDRAWSP